MRNEARDGRVAVKLSARELKWVSSAMGVYLERMEKFMVPDVDEVDRLTVRFQRLADPVGHASFFKAEGLSVDEALAVAAEGVA